MKKSILLILLLIMACEEKPRDDYAGFSEEEASIVLGGLMAARSFSNSGYGTVIENNSGIEFKKCAQGQTYNQGSGSCDNPAGRYSYCSPAGNFCNTLSIPFVLTSPQAPAYSEAYATCAGDRSGGYSNWRVASQTELQMLAAGGRNALLAWFPLPDGVFWSANAVEGNEIAANGVSFSADSFAQVQGWNKETRFFVRCARNIR